MPKPTVLESAVVAEAISGVAIGVALGFIDNQTAQLVTAIAPTVIVNLGVIAQAIVGAINKHTAAVVGAITAGK